MQADHLGPVSMSSVATEAGRPARHRVSECYIPTSSSPKAADNVSFRLNSGILGWKRSRRSSLYLLPILGMP